jgi:hypothetical protein
MPCGQAASNAFLPGLGSATAALTIDEQAFYMLVHIPWHTD